ncbi:hypothetical protein [Streptomyces sp. PRh5]|uniref:hypothetical protein n=1 Tax=Streptomyces sp. PRh5 TaxID=1158056 RepID=UPI0004AD7569|nr:hypothetical protein [Streptomyces sp. PRh5]
MAASLALLAVLFGIAGLGGTAHAEPTRSHASLAAGPHTSDGRLLEGNGRTPPTGGRTCRT